MSHTVASPLAPAGATECRGPVSRRALQEQRGPHAGPRIRIAAPRLAEDDTAILGRFSNVAGLSGLQVHATETMEAHNLDVHWRMPASLNVAVVLEGLLDVQFDNCPVQIGGGTGPVGQAWSLTRDVTVRRRSRRGMRVRKVVISLPRERIPLLLPAPPTTGPSLQRFVDRHGGLERWRPSAHAVALAERILSPGPVAMAHLAIESRAIEILREALSQIAAPAAREEPALPVREAGRAYRIRQYLLANRRTALSLDEMSRSLGMSVGSMQEAFKAAYRSTVGEFHRALRLQDARLALEAETISIAEAAFRAGYASPASFSTAFKRQFGLSPSAVRP